MHGGSCNAGCGSQGPMEVPSSSLAGFALLVSD